MAPEPERRQRKTRRESVLLRFLKVTYRVATPRAASSRCGFPKSQVLHRGATRRRSTQEAFSESQVLPRGATRPRSTHEAFSESQVLHRGAA